MRISKRKPTEKYQGAPAMNAPNSSDYSRVLTLLGSARLCPACEVVVPPSASHQALPPGQPAATHDRPHKRALPQAMSYYIISNDNCVFLTCEGISSLDEMTAAWREVQDELVEKSLNRVLVDVTALRTSPTTAELFDLAKLFWHDGLPGFGRIALVVRWDQSGSAKLLEMLVRALGMWLTVFVSKEQAEAWTLEGTQDEQAVGAFAR